MLNCSVLHDGFKEATENLKYNEIQLNGFSGILKSVKLDGFIRTNFTQQVNILK